MNNLHTEKTNIRMFGRMVRLVQPDNNADIAVQEFLDGHWQVVKTFNTNNIVDASKAATQLHQYWMTR